ncbi:hypothetical protein [Mesobacillus harenae]|uniref:hypothetical protein n=1 Tax=Mesobacillus harenae TaxID=2213203 RepID=UPI0015802FCD|nr:hypothetical protein [Mesobacillus harenae]
MAKKDFVYFLKILGTEKLAFAFCASAENTPTSAKQKIQLVLESKNIDSYQLSYLGLLDYHDMDQSIKDHLHFFEIHGDVWLLL